MSLLCQTWVYSSSFVAHCRLRRSWDARLPVVTTQSWALQNAPLVLATALKQTATGSFAFQLRFAWHVFPQQRPTDGETEKQIFCGGYLPSLTHSLTPGLTPIISEIGPSSLSCELMEILSTLFSKLIWWSSFKKKTTSSFGLSPFKSDQSDLVSMPVKDKSVVSSEGGQLFPTVRGQHWETAIYLFPLRARCSAHKAATSNIFYMVKLHCTNPCD